MIDPATIDEFGRKAVAAMAVGPSTLGAAATVLVDQGDGLPANHWCD